MAKQNTFIGHNKKPGFWSHYIDRADTDNGNNLVTVFIIGFCFAVLVFTLLYIAAEYPIAYPSKTEVKK